MKLVLMIGDIRLEAEEVGVAGDVYILDAAVATAKHFSNITPTAVKKFLVCVQVSATINVPSIVNLQLHKIILGSLTCETKRSSRSQRISID